MPVIGIIRGTGESYVATGLVIKLIKAIRARFRIKLDVIEIPLGNRESFGYELTGEALKLIKSCDALLTCDLSDILKDIEYTNEEIAFNLNNNIKCLKIKGSGKFSMLDVCIASYFDGGFKMRDGEKSLDGCFETRVCSTQTAMDVVKAICTMSEKRRRRMCFVEDSENEFSKDLFYRYFESYILPLPNFHLYRYKSWEMLSEIFANPTTIDTIYTSLSTMDSIYSVYKNLLGKDFMAYFFYADKFPVYEVRSFCANMCFNNEVPTLASYVCALSDLLNCCFGMRKEQVHLKCALDKAIEDGFDAKNGEAFVVKIKEELKKPVKTKY